jgi:aryl-alcohol dehydrogenase-like predicted oxidoreductase
MTFGEDWTWGAPKETCLQILNAYADAGGNFIDTANVYTEGTSETFLGEFLQNRRDQFVLASKFTFVTRPGDPNSAGNHRKNIRQSLEASLKRLRTDYLDLYWLHAWDGLTPIEETLRALDDLVRTGKLLHVGVSNMPAWRIAQANTLACFRGWSPFVALQIEYSLIERTVERELIPLAREMHLAVTPWSPLAGGVLTGKYRSNDASPRRFSVDDDFSKRMLTERNLKIADEVQALAKEINRPPAQVALAWLLRQPGVTSPILGVRTLDQLRDNLACLTIDLSLAHLQRLDDISRVPLGFPHDFLNVPSVRYMLTAGAEMDTD